MARLYTISQMKSKLRPVFRNRFLITLTVPGILDGETQLATFAKAAQIPGVTMGEAVAYVMGRDLYMPGDPEIQPFTVTFYSSVSNGVDTVHQEIMTWYEAMRGMHTNVGYNDPNTVYGDMLIEVLDGELANSVTTVTAQCVFPVDIPPLDKDAQIKNELSTFTVTFRCSTLTYNDLF